MKKKISEIKQHNESGEFEDYFQFVKESAEDGSYFKDALNWYFFRYVHPICDRTLLIFGSIIAFVVFYFLFQMIDSAFPLAVKEPIIVAAKDQADSFPEIVALKPKKGKQGYDHNLQSIDEAIAKYLLSVYVRDRESYDFRNAKVEDVKDKFNRIRNNSSIQEYKAFQALMDKENPTSPLNNFGRNIFKNVVIDSVVFERNQSQAFADKAKDYLSNKIPTKAEIRFTTITKITDDYGNSEEKKERYLAKISFEMQDIKSPKDGEIAKPIKFSVNTYRLFKIR